MGDGEGGIEEGGGRREVVLCFESNFLLDGEEDVEACEYGIEFSGVTSSVCDTGKRSFEVLEF